MSPFFIQEFKKSTKCIYCKASPEDGYSVCPKHLEYAKLRFRNWSKERKALSLCISCDNKSYKGFLRCKTHTLINRKNCIKWTKAQLAQNPNYNQNRYHQRKAKALETGLCQRCSEHRPIVPGHFNCRVCMDKQNTYK